VADGDHETGRNEHIESHRAQVLARCGAVAPHIARSNVHDAILNLKSGNRRQLPASAPVQFELKFESRRVPARAIAFVGGGAVRLWLLGGEWGVQKAPPPALQTGVPCERQASPPDECLMAFATYNVSAH
jgi:hypothetical protein